MTEEFLCARCARHTRTCCQDTEIHVTPGDMRRIAPYTDGVEVSEFRAPSHPVYDQSREDPVWHQHVFRDDGTRRVLKQQPGGDCVFLGPQGCRLPSVSRPLVCCLYPFDFAADGIHDQLASGCPMELLRPGQQLLQVLSMDIEEARRLHTQLYREIQESDAGFCPILAVRTTPSSAFSLSSSEPESASAPEESRLHENRPHLRSA